MSKKLVEEAIQFRDEIQELEGLLIGKLDGTKLWGDTLTDLNHDFILSSASVVVRAMKKLSESLDKKEVRFIDAELSGGFITILASEKALIIAFYGDDARAQQAIIKKNLKTFEAKIENLI